MSNSKAKTGSHQYGLRQRRPDMPMDAQLHGDDVFLTQCAAVDLGQNQDEYTSSSDIELGQKARTSSSDTDSDGDHVSHINKTRENRKTMPERDRETAPKRLHSPERTEQSVINEQILVQLQAIGHRLDVIEQTSKKSRVRSGDKGSKVKSKRVKTSTKPASTTMADVSWSATVPPVAGVSQLGLPSLQTLRTEMQIQQQVEQRLKEITDLSATGMDNKLRSQRGGVEVFVKNKVRWPHEFVLAGNTKERISYNQLNLLQWMAGFCRNMKDESNVDLRNCMLDYVIALLDDAQDFSWQAAKASHAVLLCRMEQGEVAGWSDLEKIDRIRRANAQKHTQAGSAPPLFQTAKKRNYSVGKSTKTMPCIYFNEGKCKFQKSHETAGTFFRHICTACMAADGKANNHPEVDCRNRSRQFQSKNE